MYEYTVFAETGSAKIELHTFFDYNDEDPMGQALMLIEENKGSYDRMWVDKRLLPSI